MPPADRSEWALPLLSQRLRHIDALRGLALFGVIAMNIGSMVMVLNGKSVFGNATLLDLAVAAVELLFIHGKARSSFAFLFGAGFAILLLRAQADGRNFGAFYSRRLATLLLFGLINQIFLFWGDILLTYALLGCLLLFAANWKDATLLRLGLGLVLVPPVVTGLIGLVLGQPIPDLYEPAAAERATHGLAAYTSHSYADAIAANLWTIATRHASATAHMIVYDLSVFGLFLLGSWSVRTGLLTEPERHRARLRRIAIFALPIGLGLSAISAAPYLGLKPQGAVAALVEAAYAGLPIMAFGYLAAFALQFSRSGSRVAAFLAPAGRMALTNYLLSGAIGGSIFYGYGLGLILDFGIIGTALLATGLFLGLNLFSHLWLSTFAIGPAEWVWRKLSFGAKVSSRFGQSAENVVRGG